MSFRVPTWLKPSKKKILYCACLLPLLVLAEAAYYAAVYGGSSILPPQADLVLVYSGDNSRTVFVPQWALRERDSHFLFSGWDYSFNSLRKNLKLDPARMKVEGRARTTDQNARYCAPIIREDGARSVVLALPWYHLPRALFLTRYYLWGKGITVTPYATTPLPSGWFLKPRFWEEMVKFWGSLGRIVFSWVGVENWPRPTGEP